MESDDDTFLVIVGDAVDDILTKEQTFQEFHPEFSDLNLDQVSIKEPVVVESDENISWKEEASTCSEDYAPDDKITDNNCDTAVPKKRVRMLKPSKRNSYVRKMRNSYPELRKDKKMLIDRLVAIMKESKPPPPPKDYYMMDGIMLQCVLCDHKSVSIPAASRHYQEKHGDRYLYCLACGVNFRSKTNLYKHEINCDAPDAMTVLEARAIHLGSKGRARCRPFKSSTVKRKEKFHCKECSACFNSSYSLTAHNLMHAGVRPHVCRICSRAYTSTTSLQRHERKHKEERFICDHCQKSFNSKPILIAHLLTHQPLKRFACALCPQRYSQRFYLRLHVDRDHRGLPPPHACQLCPRRYPRMSLLKIHMNNVHGHQLMTRKMFFKALPTLSNAQVNQAKLVMKRQSTMIIDPFPQTIASGTNPKEME